MTEACTKCGREVKGADALQVTYLNDHGRTAAIVCSMSCLTEWAWTRREAEPKLSKSATSVTKAWNDDAP